MLRSFCCTSVSGRVFLTAMSDQLHDFHGFRVLECSTDRPQPTGDRDVVDFIGLAGQEDAQWVALDAGWLGDGFFRLKTRLAGEILQKFITYSLRVAIVGDISRHVAESAALRDFVYECNRGVQIWFVPTLADLEQRLREVAARGSV